MDVSQGDIRHQIGNTLKAVLESYRFQTFGEYSALLSTLNIEARQVRGDYMGTPYTGIIYSATDDRGKVVCSPIKVQGSASVSEIRDCPNLCYGIHRTSRKADGLLPYPARSYGPCVTQIGTGIQGTAETGAH